MCQLGSPWSRLGPWDRLCWTGFKHGEHRIIVVVTCCIVLSSINLFNHNDRTDQQLLSPQSNRSTHNPQKQAFCCCIILNLQHLASCCLASHPFSLQLPLVPVDDDDDSMAATSYHIRESALDPEEGLDGVNDQTELDMDSGHTFDHIVDHKFKDGRRVVNWCVA